MPRKLKLEFIRDKLPVVYRHKPALRWFMILISFSIMIYSIYFMMMFVTTNTPIFFKILPIAIGFVGLDSVLKKLTSLNSIRFEERKLILGFLAKKSIEIPYQSITRLLLYKKITYYFGIEYVDESGRTRSYVSPASFPNVLEVILNISDLAPQAEIPEKMKGVLDYLKESVHNEI
jgi:hypothetical protein